MFVLQTCLSVLAWSEEFNEVGSLEERMRKSNIVRTSSNVLSRDVYSQNQLTEYPHSGSSLTRELLALAKRLNDCCSFICLPPVCTCIDIFISASASFVRAIDSLFPFPSSKPLSGQVGMVFRMTCR